MNLSRLQARRFFALFDALTDYANERLDVVGRDELYDGSARGMDEHAQARVSVEIWQNLNVIDDFVAQNPADLTAGELDIVASWREGLTDLFLVDVFPDGELRFVSGGHAFDVCGFSKDIAQMISELPAVVQTTLLPFDGRIVYAEYLSAQLVRFGDGMLDLFEEEIERTYKEGRIVSTGDELLRVASQLREEQLERDTREMLADLEAGVFSGGVRDGAVGSARDEFGDYDEGDYDDYEGGYDAARHAQHRGALADVPYDERDQAIVDHMDHERDSFKNHAPDYLRESAIEGPAQRGMAELLAHEDPYDVRRLARLMGLEGARELEGDELIADIAAHIGDEDVLQDIVNDEAEFRIQRLKELADRGGVWEVPVSEITSLGELPSHEIGLSYVFVEGDVFTFVMPDEVLAATKSLDWDAAIEMAKVYRGLIDMVDGLAELRGILTIEDVAEEYLRLHPGTFDSVESSFDWIIPSLMKAVVEGIANFDMIETESRDMYVLHYELFWEYEAEMGLEHETFTIQPVTMGELGEMLEGLLRMQQGKEPRSLTDDMLAARDLFEWKLQQPATRRLVQYLDAHVPAVRDDYYFADKVIEELLRDAMWGMIEQGPKALFDILEANDFVPEADQIQTLLDLWSAMTNSLPVWPNNGWAPNELVERELGHPLFFDENSRPRKIGRNDPCPCGSGLKYKKCCGR